MCRQLGWLAPRLMLHGLVLLVLNLSGCTKMYAVDPPEVNSHRHLAVRLYVLAPPTLHPTFAAEYQTGIWLGMMGGGGRFCGTREERNPSPNTVATPMPHVDVPIAVKYDGRGYSGTFYLDQFKPGRCRWKFFQLKLMAPAEEGVTRFEDDITHYNFDTSHSRGLYDQSADQATDLWCAPDPSPQPAESGKPLCTMLDYFEKYPGIVSPELHALVPHEQNMPIVNVFPFTKSITLRIHDLQSENRAAMAAAVDSGATSPR